MPEEFEGTFDEGKKAKMQRKSDNAKNIRLNRMAAAVASECITQQIPPIGTTIQDKLESPLQFPPWANSLHVSHSIKHVGGASFCEHCGSVMTCFHKHHALLLECKNKIPSGSKTRLNSLLKGKAYKGLNTWPNGADGATIQKVISHANATIGT